MATTGMSAFQMFKNKTEQRQKQKKENVVSFIKAENEKKKKRRDEKNRKAEEESKEGKKRRRRGKRKTREEKEARRDEQLTRSVDKSLATQRANRNNNNDDRKKNTNNKDDDKSGDRSPKDQKRNLGMQKEDLEKLTAMGKVTGAFVSHARKKLEEKAGSVKRKREDDAEEEDAETHQSRAKSQMELIFGKSAEKVKPGSYQHNRIMITSEKIESIVEASKGKKAAKKKRKENDVATMEEDGDTAVGKQEEQQKQPQQKQKQQQRQLQQSSTSPKGILKKPFPSPLPQDTLKPTLAPALSSVPGWRKLSASADTEEEGMRAFEWLISPVEPKKFFAKLWEKKPLLVKRKCPDYNAGWFSTSELDLILRKNSLLFGENIDVVTYSRNGKRETHNPEGRAHASVVWDHYQQGCSVRLLNPQSYSSRCWKMLSTLQEFFGCFAGANVYLTPPGSQGFAPHYDDIEAFVLQLEGRKRWRLYDPRTPTEVLPRYSSSNFEQDELGECILDTVLEPGDMLYFPRGVIHQAVTQDENHSLHVTVSTYQKTTWADLFEKMIPHTLAAAVEEDVEFRRGLPVGYLNHLGIGNQDSVTEQRMSFLKTVSKLFDKLKETALVDASVDQMAKSFLHDSLPPYVNDDHLRRSCRGAGEHWRAQEGRVGGVVELEPETAVKILTKKSLRIVMENDAVWVFYATENLRTWHKRDPMCFEIPAEQAENVEALIHAYPEFVKIDDLPAGTQEGKLTTMNALYDRGLVVTQVTLDTNWMYSDDDSEEEEELGKVLVVDGDVESDEESGEEEEEGEEEDDDEEVPEPVKIKSAEDDDYEKE